MISSVNLMTGCNFVYQIILAGHMNGHGGPHVARRPRVGRAWPSTCEFTTDSSLPIQWMVIG